MQKNQRRLTLIPATILLVLAACSQQQTQQDVVSFPDTRSSEVSDGWAQTSVNAVIFRRDSITTHEGTQIIAFYDEHSRVTLARRQIGSDNWTVQASQYEGDATDAHNSISIMMDGDGYLHLAWNHHVDQLHYAVSLEPMGLELGARQVMMANQENKVTYPEFHRLSDGSLISLIVTVLLVMAKPCSIASIFMHALGRGCMIHSLMVKVNAIPIGSYTWDTTGHYIYPGVGARARTLLLTMICTTHAQLTVA